MDVCHWVLRACEAAGQSGGIRAAGARLGGSERSGSSLVFVFVCPQQAVGRSPSLWN